MKLRKAKITNFSAFGRAEFEFSDGLNVIIGSNGTGKTHLLKLLYSVCATSPKRKETMLVNEMFSVSLWQKLADVFRPDNNFLSHLIHNGRKTATVAIDWASEDDHAKAARVAFEIQGDSLQVVSSDFKEHIRSLFIPSREVLAMFPGFVPAYEERELAFDETYYDLCKALMQNLLKTRGEDREKLVQGLEKELGGIVILDGTKFYIKQAHDKGRGTEVQLVSEGMRKLAMLAHLIRNGAVRRQGIVFWDEPESSLNPKLIPVMARVLADIAAMGVQVFIATHDYLLTRELSLMAEHAPQGKSKKKTVAPIKFFCLSKDKTGGVVPEEGATLADLDQNPILEEFVAHYEREQRMFIEG